MPPAAAPWSAARSHATSQAAPPPLRAAIRRKPVLDGVYRCGAAGVPELVEVGLPTDDELHALLQTIITRLIKLLTRRGVLVKDSGQTYLAEPAADGDEVRPLGPLRAAVCNYPALPPADAELQASPQGSCHEGASLLIRTIAS